MKKFFAFVVRSLVFLALVAAASSVLTGMLEKKKEKEYLSTNVYL
jgi:hypothetical protein